MVRRIASVLLLGAVCLPVTVAAHHSSAAYDMRATASVTGRVRALSWRNPHVLIELDVEGNDGRLTTWTLETTAPTSLAAAGWSRDLLAEGTPITAEIRPTRLGAPAGILRWVTLANGAVLPIDPESPAGSAVASRAVVSADESVASLAALAAESRRAWLQRRDGASARNRQSLPATLPLIAPDGEPSAFDPDNIARHSAVSTPFDVTGVWQFRREEEHYRAQNAQVWDFMPLPRLTPKAQAIYDETMAARAAGTNAADPTALCYPPGMPRIMTRIGSFMLVQRPTALYMVHRFNNDLRTIFLDGRAHVDAAVRQDSYNGDSIGIWEDDSLFVETIGFGQPNQFVQAGLPIGAQARVTERWRLLNDGNTIEIEFVVTDPEHWEGEWVDTKLYDRIHGADIREANCIAAEDSKIPGSVEAALVGSPGAPAATASAAGDADGVDGRRGFSLTSLLGGVLIGLAGGLVLSRRRRA